MTHPFAHLCSQCISLGQEDLTMRSKLALLSAALGLQ
jgi:hypothetical protein